MKKVLSDIPRELSKSNIDLTIEKYLCYLKEVPLTIQAEDILGLLRKIKRTNLKSGPYPDVSLFEAANRIMTDLIILFGVKKLLNGAIDGITFDNYTVELGNEDNNDFDLFANDGDNLLIGEAFNVAKSFFQTKKAKSLKKMRGDKAPNKKLLLIYNADAVEKYYKPKLDSNEYHLAVQLHLPQER
ncbi:MAG: hypothetical protein RJQ09_17215 [Cyclobacteriaceae bacterium]